MSEINDRLTKFNPSLIGSQVIEGIDIESSVIQTGRKEDSGRKVALRDDKSVMSI